MNIKKFSPFAAIAFLLALGLSSCSPYEEGPALSLRSKAERVANTWKINYAVEADGDDKTSDYNTTTMIPTKEKALTVSFDIDLGLTVETFTATGTWEFADDDKQIRMQYTYDVLGVPFSVDETYDILKLAEEEMWIKDVDDEGIELHMVPK